MKILVQRFTQTQLIHRKGLNERRMNVRNLLFFTGISPFLGENTGEGMHKNSLRNQFINVT